MTAAQLTFDNLPTGLFGYRVAAYRPDKKYVINPTLTLPSLMALL